MGIWKYAKDFKPFVEEEFRLSLTQEETPLQQNVNLAKTLNLQTIHLKREDKNLTGSHKDRGVAFQISAHIQDGKKEFAISSSGNSAISAIKILAGREEKLHVFLPEGISEEKLDRLRKISQNFKIHYSKKPLSNAFKFAKENEGCVLLRGSTDKYATQGFQTISYEIEDVDFDSIFIPTSSGTTAKGIYDGMKKTIPFHIIQTTKINTLVSKFDKDFKVSEHSLATSIVDRVGHRRDDIEDIIVKTKGSGWVIGDEDIEKAQEILKKENIHTSNESALTIAGTMKAKEKGFKIEKPLCIFTGTK